MSSHVGKRKKGCYMTNLIRSVVHYIYDEDLLPLTRENLANYITLTGAWLSRIGLYLFVLYFMMFWHSQTITDTALIVRWTAIVLFILAAICDGIDGYVARKIGVTSRFGELYDPHLDKVQYMTKIGGLIIDAFVAALSGLSFGYAIMVFLISYFSHERDLASMFHRAWALSVDKDIKVKAGIAGKIRTAVCFPAILIMFAIINPLNWIWAGVVVTAIIIVVTTWSNYQYVHNYRAAIKEVQRSR